MGEFNMKFNFISLSFLLTAVICGVLGQYFGFRNNKIVMIIGYIGLFGGIVIWVITGKL